METAHHINEEYKYVENGIAAQYDRARPSYSSSIFDLLPKSIKTGKHRIAEIGAGTGIFTSFLCKHYDETIKIIAIEPMQNMRDILRSKFLNVGNVHVYNGKAENLSFIDNDSIDIIFCAQSFHWFANKTALKEFERILSKKSNIILIWNKPKYENHLFLDSLFKAIDYDIYKVYDESLEDKKTFLNTNNLLKLGIESFEGFKFDQIESSHSQILNVNGLIDLITSWSKFASMNDVQKKQVIEIIKQQIIKYYGSLNVDNIIIPYKTIVFHSKCFKQNKKIQSKL
eukprot:152191_1